LILTVKVLEVGQLDALSHTQNIGGGAQAVEHHPEVPSVQSRHGFGCGLGSLADTVQGMLNVCPRRDDGAEDHQAKGEESHGCDGAAKPEHLSVSNEDDCQVFEDGVDGDGEELEGPGARVNHADEEEGDGEPCRCQSSYSL
jgi:hypothetical protein